MPESATVSISDLFPHGYLGLLKQFRRRRDTNTTVSSKSLASWRKQVLHVASLPYTHTYTQMALFGFGFHQMFFLWHQFSLCIINRQSYLHILSSRQGWVSSVYWFSLNCPINISVAPWMGDTYRTSPQEALLGEGEPESCVFAVLITAVCLGRRRKALVQGGWGGGR